MSSAFFLLIIIDRHLVFFPGNGDKGIWKFEVPAALSAGYVLLFSLATGSNMALDGTT